jgi:hypothetical protein
MAQAQVMTRKQSHAEAVILLERGAAILDQAHSLLLAARTAPAVEATVNGRRITSGSVVDTVAQLVQSAREVTCDDCELLMCACKCAWANSEVA